MFLIQNQCFVINLNLGIILVLAHGLDGNDFVVMEASKKRLANLVKEAGVKTSLTLIKTGLLENSHM